MQGGSKNSKTTGTGINVKLFEAKTGKYLDSQFFQYKSKLISSQLYNSATAKTGNSNNPKVESVNGIGHDISNDVISKGHNNNKKILQGGVHR